MIDFDSQVDKYIKKYEKTKEPICVNFRELIPHLNNADRATHLIHSYPAKLLPHIPYFFLNNNFFSIKNDKVLDSFCGSGTVLLESVLAGRRSIGADSNPLARLISRTKVRHYDIQILNDLSKELLSKIDGRKKGHQPYVVNVDYWFLPKIKRQLAVIINAIELIQDQEYKEFFYVCFSNMVKKVSLADPRVSVPVRLKPNKYPVKHVLRKESKLILESLEILDIKNKFYDIIKQNIKRFEKLNLEIYNKIGSSVDSEDARKLINAEGYQMASESVQMFISSPPYSGAQKYIRSSSLSLGWLGLTQEETVLRKLEMNSIGRENYYRREFSELKRTSIKEADLLLDKIFKKYPQRAHIASNYLIEMKESLREAVRVIKNGGYLVLVIGNNKVCGYEFKTQEYLCSIAESLGLRIVFKLIDDIKSYGLMTKRNKTADIITREWILVFKK